MKAISLFLLLILVGCEEQEAKFNAHQRIRQRLQDDIYTVEHEGHQFVVYRGNAKGGIIHHPGCKCIK